MFERRNLKSDNDFQSLLGTWLLNFGSFAQSIQVYKRLSSLRKRIRFLALFRFAFAPKEKI